MSDDHESIYLQPWCDGCEKHAGEGRLWCQDEVWGQCDECDQKPVKYIRADLASVPAQAAPDSAIDVLREIVEYETKSAIELEALAGDEMPELPWMAKAKAVIAAQPPAAPVETDVSVHEYVANYRFELDGGESYCPRQHEAEMIEDAIEGYLACCGEIARPTAEPGAVRAARPAVPNSSADTTLETIYAALSQAQDCIRGETPEDIGDEAAREDTIDKVRDAMRLVEHLQAQPQRSADRVPDAWQWRYVGEPDWNTPSGGRKLTDEELKREHPIEQRPLYADVPQPPSKSVKLCYVKRWRTLVELPENYADEIVEALRAPKCSACGDTGFINKDEGINCPDCWRPSPSLSRPQHSPEKDS